MRIPLMYLLFACISLPLIGQGQDIDSRTPQRKRFPITHQIGINGTTLLKQFVKGADSTTAPSPYLFTYKFGLGPFVLRTGLGGSMRSESLQQEGYADSETDEFFSVEARVGLEYQAAMGKRWQGSFGVDYLGFGQEDRHISDTGFDKVTTSTQTKGWGVGPAIGLRFLVNQRLSIYTEGAFYYTQSERINSRLFTNFPQFDDQISDATLRDIRLLLPTSIFIVYEF
ncbi:MAG: hypothetical protein AAF587_01710 [Bacteroidota bacterium]